MGSQLWGNQISELRVKTGAEKDAETILNARDLASVDVSKTIYHAVFTAHPVFSLTATNSCKLSEMAGRNLATPFPDNAYDPRTEISLQDEHSEATSAIKNAREAIMSLHKRILQEKHSKTRRVGVTVSLNYLRFQLGLDTTLTGGLTSVGLTASNCVCLRRKQV